jgi:hypothetical protein
MRLTEGFQQDFRLSCPRRNCALLLEDRRQTLATRLTVMYLQVSLTEKSVESGKQIVPLYGWVTQYHIKRKLRQYVHCNAFKRDGYSVAGKS